jgi:hypothetical protein
MALTSDSMRALEIGLVLPMGDSFVDGRTVRWAEIRGFRAFQGGGFDHLEVILWPPTLQALDAMGPVLALVS